LVAASQQTTAHFLLAEICIFGNGTNQDRTNTAKKLKNKTKDIIFLWKIKRHKTTTNSALKWLNKPFYLLGIDWRKCTLATCCCQ
jgi:hypothetical protein